MKPPRTTPVHCYGCGVELKSCSYEGEPGSSYCRGCYDKLCESVGGEPFYRVGVYWFKDRAHGGLHECETLAEALEVAQQHLRLGYGKPGVSIVRIYEHTRPKLIKSWLQKDRWPEKKVETLQ